MEGRGYYKNGIYCVCAQLMLEGVLCAGCKSETPTPIKGVCVCGWGVVDGQRVV